MDEIILETYNKNPVIRAKAVRKLCPCKLRADYPEAWNRIKELVYDEDSRVRYNVLHTLCDGSPKETFEDEIEDILNIFKSDKDNKVRRKANQVIAKYLKTGKWNVL